MLLDFIFDTLADGEVGLGRKATQLIVGSTDPLTTLKGLSQDFPKFATSLARRVEVEENIEKELHDNQLTLPAGANVFWLNGVNVPEKDVTPFGVLRMLKKERANMQALTALGLERSQAMDLLTHVAIAQNQMDKGVDSEDTEWVARENGEEEDGDASFKYNYTLLHRDSFDEGVQHTLTVNVYDYPRYTNSPGSDFLLDSVIIGGGAAIARDDAPSSGSSTNSATSPSDSNTSGTSASSTPSNSSSSGGDKPK